MCLAAETGRAANPTKLTIILEELKA